MATTSASNDDSESVDQFLARIASLKDRRDREDEERTRKLEEEIMQGRRERQARRAERARSISPSKASPAASVSSVADLKTMAGRSIEPPIDLSPRKAANTPTKPMALQSRDPPDSPTLSLSSNATRPLPTPPRGADTFTAPPTNVNGPARGGNLPWQQRPSSRDSNSSRPRPLSGVPTAFANDPTTNPLDSKSTGDLSRSEIAQSLESKDASWFRQTSDRGLSSAAYRKNQVESESAVDTFSASRSMRLPGMSRESTAEPERPSTPRGGFEKRAQPLPDETDPDSAYARNQTSNNVSVESSPRNALAMPLGKLLKLEPTMTRPADFQPEQDADRAMLPPTVPTTSSDRPASPTKGLGGFVQSAMMKRSDSVNKRWSVQANAGLKRGDSIASNRSTLAAAGTPALGASRSPTRASRILGGDIPSSPLGSSRPSSSHGEDVVSTRATPTAETQASPKPLRSTTDETVLERGRSVEPAERPSNSTQDGTLPVSPTKTLEPRRWSPTKASWLESALTRPESPKIISPPVEQPSWKTDLQRSKQPKAIQESVSSSFSVVSPAGLLRSPPPGGHARPLSISGMPEGFSSGTIKKAPAPRAQPKPEIVSKLPHSGTPKEGHSVQISTPTASSMDENNDEHELQSGLPSSKPESPAVSAVKATREPPAVKPKPQTPPKTDFRANLKSRQDTSSKDDNTEPEFKAVFGKLKRTQTQNYIAPDELKANVTRGKAGLSLSSGPKKTKHVDEFKESILQKKEAMKSGSGSIHGRPDSKTPVVPEKPVTVLPEALAKRQLLGKANLSTTPATKSKAEHVAPPIRQKSTMVGSSLTDDNQAASPQTITTSGNATWNRNNPDPEAESSQSGSAELPLSIQKETISPTPVQSKTLETSQIATRLNPSLASLLSRSSSPHLRNSSPSARDSSPRPSAAAFARNDSSEESTGLTHMTKARAKGPKRRAPKSEPISVAPAVATAESRAADSFEKAKTSNPSELEPATEKKPPITPRRFESTTRSQPEPVSMPRSLNPKPPMQGFSQDDALSVPSKKAPAISVAKDVESAKAEETQSNSKPKPLVATKSPELRKVSSPPATKINDNVQPSKFSSPQKFNIATDEVSKAPSPASKFFTQANPANPDTSASLPLAPSTTKVNTPRASRMDGNVSPPKPPTSQSRSKVKGLGLELDRGTYAPKASTIAPEPTPPPEKSGKQYLRPTLEAMGGFFDQMPKYGDKADFDTEKILSTRTEISEKTKTLSMQICEISGGGKKQTMPSQQEHILYEECMYLCTHTFENAAGNKSTEVYLWSGDGVADAAVEDAQLFCRKIARENNARLEVVRQGNEPSHFFQALGGIVITRRSKSSALYMLCGRRHLGHVAFDEVDLDAANLCSGFPYIISAKFGKLYLWKGQGSGADELGCARLMGMDLCLTGEMEEVKEGEEPAAFFDSFPNPLGKRKPSSEQWEIKSGHSMYECRLYRVEHDRPKSTGFWGRRGSSPPKLSNKALVTEISPFCQRDLEPGHIYILDTYFRFYVFPGVGATSKSAEFVTAAHLAQEMSYMAPTVTDRPLMATCHAIFGEPPVDFTANFRKWQPPRNARPLNELDLAYVIEAMD